MSRILVIDNYDSFVYNLVHYLRELEQEVLVLRNDKFELDSISEFDRVLLSPGPGIPSEAGKMMDLIEYNLDRNDCIPMLGGLFRTSSLRSGSWGNASQSRRGLSRDRILDHY